MEYNDFCKEPHVVLMRMEASAKLMAQNLDALMQNMDHFKEEWHYLECMGRMIDQVPEVYDDVDTIMAASIEPDLWRLRIAADRLAASFCVGELGYLKTAMEANAMKTADKAGAFEGSAQDERKIESV